MLDRETKYEVYIHPNKKLSEEDIELIKQKAPNFKIVQPGLDELNALCGVFFSRPSADSEEFWNPDHAFFVPIKI